MGMIKESLFIRKVFLHRDPSHGSFWRADNILATVAYLASTIVAIFLINMAVSLWRNITYQRNLIRESNISNIRAVGAVLAKATEAMMAANEISMLRRAVAEAGVENKLKCCRIVLPDGGIIADADPSRITVIKLPESWISLSSAGRSKTYTEKFDGTGLFCSFPLDVPGRGSAFLEITAKDGFQLKTGLASQAAPLTIACLGLAMMWLIHHHTQLRLKGIATIHQALMAIKESDLDAQSLEVDPQLGQEAVMWNKLLGAKEGLQIRAAIEQVKESIDEKSEGYDELTAACDALPHGLILVGRNMRIHYANGAAAALLQRTCDELINADITEFITDQRVLDAIQRAGDYPSFARTIVETEPEGATKSGILRFIVRPVRRGDYGIAVIIIEDITQKRVAEAARNSFLGHAAHELRTPLANIRLYVENALEDCKNDPLATAKSLNVINEESRRLERVVAEILSVSEIEAGSFQLKRDDVNFDEILKNLKADYEPQAKEKKIKLKFNLPPKLPVLHADRDKICLALHNLLGNALKYTLQKGEVTVIAAVQTDRLCIDVKDTGIGISPDEKEKIFEKFYRSKDKRVSNITGSGLGLAIAREVIRLHGGDISVESEPDKGSTFTLTLPITEEVV
jgi:signal transduction histidine kinase